MRLRVIGLGLLLIFRLMVGWLEVAKYERGREIRLTGKAIIIEQSQSKCVYSLGRWWWRSEDKCLFSQTAEVRVVGRVNFQLIDMFLGRLWLMEPDIIHFEEEKQSESLIDRNLRLMREKVMRILRQNLTEPESGLVAGIVMGYQEDLPYEFYQQLIASGTVHVVVASGYNVMIVAGVAMALLFFFCKRRMATVIAIILIWFYVLISGLSAPVVRAAIMGSMVLLGRAMGRGAVTWWSLMVAVWAMVMMEPLMLLSVSFQLSVAATAGMVLLSDKLKRTSVVIEKTGLSESLAAQTMTLPIIWWHFARVSWIAPLSNILIVPLVPILMALGGAMIGLGLIWGPLASIMMVPTYAIAHLMVVLVRFFG